MLDLVPKPQFTVLIPPKLLQEGYLVYFTKAWPSTMNHVRGKLFRVEVANQVPYDAPKYIIPASDYKDIDLSNNTDGLKLYPTNNFTLYETLIGFRPGNFLSQWYIPADKYVHYLEYAGMSPDVTSATLVYLGARKPEDSPYDDPRIKLYFPMDVASLIIRLYVLPGVDYEKIMMSILINKCKLSEITSPTEDQLLKAKVIRYFDELRW